MVMWLLSYTQHRLVEPRCPASEAASLPDAFHHVPVAAEDVHVVVEELEARAGCTSRRASGRPWPCRRSSPHPDRAGRWSPRRPTSSRIPDARGSGCLPAGNVLMSSSVTAGRPSLLVGRVRGLDVGQVDAGCTAASTRARREHESVAIGPMGVGRVVAEKALPERIGGRRGIHRRARVPGLCLLDGVDGQRANGVDAEPVERLRSGHDASRPSGQDRIGLERDPIHQMSPRVHERRGPVPLEPVAECINVDAMPGE